MTRNTSEKTVGIKSSGLGVINETRVQLRLLEMGVHVLVPIGHDHPFDLVAYEHGQFCRIQVKTARDGIDAQRRHNGSIVISAYSMVDKKGGGGFKEQKVLTTEDCDVIIAYYYRLDKFYIVRPGQTTFWLRYTDAKNGNKIKIREADDYELRRPDQLFSIISKTKEQSHVADTPIDRPLPKFENMPLFTTSL